MGNTFFIQEKRVCVRPLHNRLEAIQRLKPHITVRSCIHLMEMVNFLSIFCPNLQKVLKPIYDLTRKDRQFICGQEQQKTFDKIKCRLQKPPVLHLPDGKGDSIYIQIPVSMPWTVLCTRYRMVNLS